MGKAEILCFLLKNPENSVQQGQLGAPQNHHGVLQQNRTHCKRSMFNSVLDVQLHMLFIINLYRRFLYCMENSSPVNTVTLLEAAVHITL